MKLMNWLNVFRCCLATGICLAHCAIADAASITVSGSAQVEVVPDRAMLSIGVNTRNADPAAAQQENTDTMKKLIAAIEGAGIQREDMQTSSFRFQRYTDEVSGDGEATPVYRVSNNLGITVKDIAKVGEIIALSVKNGGNDIGEINFYVAKPQPYVDQSRKEAFKDAQREAMASAEAAGLKLGSIIDISGGRATNSSIQFCPGCADAPEAASVQDLAPVTLAGTVLIGYDVTVQYELK